MNTIVVPASMQSKRIPGKPLVDIGGMPLVVRTLLAAREAQPDRLILTTDSVEVQSALQRVKKWRDLCDVIYLSCKPYHNGTQRVGDAMRNEMRSGMAGCDDIVVNWQVDEPFVLAEDVKRAIKRQADVVERDTKTATTLVMDLQHKHIHNWNVVKAVCEPLDVGYRALYFSREPLMYGKHHIGIYCFDYRSLMSLSNAKRSQCSLAEQLEQLDWIVRVRTVVHALAATTRPISINTQEDLENAVAAIETHEHDDKQRAAASSTQVAD